MKRIISLCCVALIFVFSLAAPARATESDNSAFFDVLDYTYIDTANSRNSVAVASGDNSITVTLPYSMRLYYIDMLVMCNGNIASVSCSVSSSSKTLTVSALGHNNLYRIYGSMPGRASAEFTLNFNLTSGSYLTFYQLRTCKVASLQYDIEGYCDIVSAEYTSSIHYVPTDDINYRLFSATDSYTDNFFYCYIWSDDWRNYDYLDFQLMFDVFDITSISAVMGSENIPLDVSYLDGTAIEGNSYYITMSLDITKLDRTSDDYPMIIVMGRLDSGVVNSIDFANCSGGVYTETVNPLFLYFNMLSEWITTQTTAIKTQFTQLKTALSTHFTNLGTWIDTQTEAFEDAISDHTSAMKTQFTNLKTALSTHFTNLGTWLETQTEAIENAISSQTSKIKSALSTHFSNLSSWIETQTDTLESAIRGDTSSGDAFQGEVQEELDELDQAQAVMDSVTKPAIEDINVSVDKYVSQADINVLASPMAAFFENQLFSRMIIMSILLATVSYVLYGKR